MLIVIFVFMGVMIVAGAIYLVMKSGLQGGRHAQSPTAVVGAQRQQKSRGESIRATGGDD